MEGVVIGGGVGAGRIGKGVDAAAAKDDSPEEAVGAAVGGVVGAGNDEVGGGLAAEGCRGFGGLRCGGGGGSGGGRGGGAAAGEVDNAKFLAESGCV